MDIRKFFAKPSGTVRPAGDAAPKLKAEAEDSSKAAEQAAQAPAEPVPKWNNSTGVTTSPSAAAATDPDTKVGAVLTKGKGGATSASPGTKRAKVSPKKAPPQKKEHKPKPKPAPKRKKQQILDDDSDEDSEALSTDGEGQDSDFEIDLTGCGGDDESDGWEEELEEPAPKKRKAAGRTPARPSPATKGQKKEEAEGELEGEEKPSTAKKSRAKAATPVSKKTPTSGNAKKAAAKGPLAGLSAEAVAAVEAVDAAAKKLPPKEELGITFMAEGAFHQRAPDEPPHWREKALPRGHPDCLTGKTIVISGVLDSLKREEAADFVKRHGGKVTGNVSSRTSFLVAGQFCGRSKYNAAEQHGTQIISEDGLLSLVAAAPDPNALQEGQPLQLPAAVVKQEPAGTSGALKEEEEQQQQGVASVGAKSFYGSCGRGGRSVPAAPSSALAALNNFGRTAAGATSTAGAAGTAAGGSAAMAAAGTQLWVEKWRPKVAQDLVGNGTLVATLRQWLRDWESVHLHGAQPIGPPGSSSGARRDKLAADMKKKAVLLSGPPGIGKTTAALIVCRELGFEPVEVNASDTRGKADSSVVKGVGGKLANAVKELSTNLAISYDAEGHRKKLCLIMDEVDGMSAGDRGGVADLIQTIHKSKVPIITICNDKYSPKLKSLRNHTLELDFRKPSAQQISKRMLEICREEGLQMNQATMEALAQSANGDIRLVLGQLQMIRLRAKALSYDQVRKGGIGSAKDFEMSPFEAARKLLSLDCDSLSLGDQIDLVFQDMDLVPLLVQENYINHRPRLAYNDSSRIQILAKAADSFSGGDVVTRRVRQYQSWSLMPFACVLGTVTPAAWMRGGREVFGLFPGENNFPRFTAWLGNNSSQGKQRRLMGELHTRMLASGNFETDRTSLRLSYLPVLRNTLVRPLVKDGKEGIPAVLKQMRDYCLAREDVDFITDVTKWKGSGAWKEDPMKQVDTQTKSAFTRTFNQQHIKPRTGFGLEDGTVKKKGKGRGRGTAASEDEDTEGGLAEAAEVAEGASPPRSQQEEEEEEVDPVMIRQKAMAMKSKGLILTLKDGTQQATGRGAKSGGRGRGSRGGAASGGGRGSGRGKAAASGSAGRGPGSGRGRGAKK